MTRNTKIALGCGGAGCLVLVLAVVVVGVAIFTGLIAAPGIYSPNRNSNYNYNYNRNSNYNTNNSNTNSNESTDDSSSSMSEDDKHKLFQAAGITQDSVLILRVLRKIGYPNGTGAGYDTFVKEHINWAVRNADWVRSVLDKDKARAYVEEHIDD
jgi:hypothetical protein